MSDSSLADNLLESALEHAFSPPPSRRQSALAESTGNLVETVEEQTATSSVAASTSSSDDKWKEDYDSMLKTWRNQSAEAREKAEKERLRWERVRASQGPVTEEDIRGPPTLDHSWSVVKPTPDPVSLPSPSPADARDLTTGETNKNASHTQSQPDAQEGSQKWEDVPSLTSSFPSMSFPEHSNTPPSLPEYTHQPFAASASIFDSSLSTRTRVLALASSVAINFLLPFVNGVMLGFGEIFGKTIFLGWLGRRNATTRNR